MIQSATERHKQTRIERNYTQYGERERKRDTEIVLGRAIQGAIQRERERERERQSIIFPG